MSPSSGVRILCRQVRGNPITDRWRAFYSRLQQDCVSTHTHTHSNSPEMKHAGERKSDGHFPTKPIFTLNPLIRKSEKGKKFVGKQASSRHSTDAHWQTPVFQDATLFYFPVQTIQAPNQGQRTGAFLPVKETKASNEATRSSQQVARAVGRTAFNRTPAEDPFARLCRQCS